MVFEGIPLGENSPGFSLILGGPPINAEDRDDDKEDEWAAGGVLMRSLWTADPRVSTLSNSDLAFSSRGVGGADIS